MDALDISNNTTRFTVDHVQQWKAGGVGLAIIQLITGVYLAGDDCATQIQTCLDGGLAVDCYLFPGNDGLPLSAHDRLALVPPDLKPRIRQLWVDVEPAYRDPSMVGVNAALAECDRWAPWQTTGTYSALWVADKLHWHPWPWPDRKQWLVYVRNDGTPNLGGTFDGTDHHVMTQYRMDVTENGVSGMDRSWLTGGEAQAVLDWLNGGDVTDEEKRQMQDKIDGLVGALGYVAGDLLKPVASQKTGSKAVQKLVAGIRGVADQQGIAHA